MKAKSTVPEKGKWLESPEVEPSEQPVTQADKEDLDIDLNEFPALFKVDDILEKLYRTPTPEATDCEDEGCWAYKEAHALLTYIDLADEGLDAQGSTLPEPIAGYVVDAVRLQLDIMRLAGKRLYLLCQAHDSHESGDSRNS